MHNEIIVIEKLTKAIDALTEWLKFNTSAATKQDLNEAKREILKAIGERVRPGAVQDLKAATGELDKAVKANT